MTLQVCHLILTKRVQCEVKNTFLHFEPYLGPSGKGDDVLMFRIIMLDQKEVEGAPDA